LRVLKPGAHGIVWALPRTSHWTATALEDAGFEIRDVVTHLFGSGFPKSMDVAKAIDKHLGVAGTLGEPKSEAHAVARGQRFKGWGTALKPASEHWIVVRKPLAAKNVAANVLKHGTGALNIDGCRIGTEEVTTQHTTMLSNHGMIGNVAKDERTTHSGRWPANVVLSHHPLCEVVGERVIKGDNRDPSGADPGGFYDVGSDDRATAPSGALHGDTVAEVWDCVPGCAVAQLDAQSGESTTPTTVTRGASDSWAGGGASRFFYVAKPSTDEKQNALKSLSLFDSPDKPFFCACVRKPVALADQSQSDHEKAHATGFCADCGGLKSRHPTVKPVELMRYFCRLVTPPGGTVLDCFAGSGTTGVAALAEGFDVILVEREPDYAATVRARCERAAMENGRT
jgi:site-specific DNA-methyltransferase (adenine-specific)